MEKGAILNQLESSKNNRFPMLKYYGYALTLTTPTADLCNLYFDCLSNRKVRAQIQNLIKKKVEHRADPIPPAYLERLLEEFPTSTSAIKKSISDLIITLQTYFPKEQLMDFFDEQIYSDIADNRKTAIMVSPSLYNGDVDEKLWQCWFDFEDRVCMEILLDNSSLELLSIDFKSIWDSENLSRNIKLKCLKKIARYRFETVRFLKNEDPPSYLTACIVGGENVSDEYCLEALKSIDRVDRLDYAIWCMGMLEKRDLLLRIPNDLQRIMEGLLVS